MPPEGNDAEPVGLHPAERIEEHPFGFQKGRFLRFQADIKKVFPSVLCRCDIRCNGISRTFLYIRLGCFKAFHIGLDIIKPPRFEVLYGFLQNILIFLLFYFDHNE